MSVPTPVVLDANAVDPLVDQPGAYEILERALLEGRVTVLYTHVTLEELAKVPDLERRQRLLLALTGLGRLVPTGAFVLDFSRLNHARLNDDVESFDAFRSGNVTHTADALIAVTAAVENALLVTADQRLSGRARDRGLQAMTMPDLLTLLANTQPDSAS